MARFGDFFTLSNAELGHFLRCKDWREHEPPYSGPVPSAARFALSTVRRTWKTRETPVDLAGRLGVSEHANGDFLHLVEDCGYAIPRPSPVRTSLPVRSLATIISLGLAVTTHRRLQFQLAGSGTHGAWIATALGKMLSRLAVLAAFGVIHPRSWTVLVAGAHLGLNRMPSVFAANRLGIPMVLVFLDDERLTPRASLHVVRGDLVIGCIAFSPDLPRRAGLTGDYALALRQTNRVSKSTNFAALSVGVAIDRGVTPRGVASLIEELSDVPNVRTILLRLHPSHDSAIWSATVEETGSKVALSSEESIDHYAERVDLCLSTWTGARNRLRRAGVPVWYLGGAVFGETAGSDVRERWTDSDSDIPRVPQNIGAFLSGLTETELEAARTPPETGVGASGQRRESACSVARRAIESAGLLVSTMGSGDGRPDGTRARTA